MKKLRPAEAQPLAAHHRHEQRQTARLRLVRRPAVLRHHGSSSGPRTVVRHDVLGSSRSIRRRHRRPLTMKPQSSIIN